MHVLVWNTPLTTVKFPGLKGISAYGFQGDWYSFGALLDAESIDISHEELS